MPRKKLTAAEVCPITGTPLTMPGQTVSRAAVALLREDTQTLADLMVALVPENLPREIVAAGGGRTQPGSRPPLRLDAMDEIDSLRNKIGSWAMRLARHLVLSEKPPRSWAKVQALFQACGSNVIQWREAPEMIREVREAVHTASALLAGPVPSRFAGLCVLCLRPLVSEGEGAVVICRACGTASTVAGASEAAWREMEEVWLLPSDAAAAASLILQRPVPAATVRSHIHRGRITPVSGRVRVGDITALS